MCDVHVLYKCTCTCRSNNSDQTASSGDSDDDGSDDGAAATGGGKKVVRWRDKQDDAGTSTSRVIHFSHSTPQSAQVGARNVYVRACSACAYYSCCLFGR